MIDLPPVELAGVANADGALDVGATAAAQVRELATNNRLLAEHGGDPDSARVAKLLDGVAALLDTVFAGEDDAAPPLPDNVTRLTNGAGPRPVPPGGDVA